MLKCNISKGKWIGLFALLLLGLMFYLNNRYSSFSYDDQTYCYAFTPYLDNLFPNVLCDGYERIKITSLASAFDSQVLFYQYVNGRFIIHLFVQYFSAHLSMQQFAILNTFIYLLLVITLLKLTFGFSLNWKKFICSIFCFFFLIPYPGLTCWDGIAYTMNYLWVSFFFCLLYLVYEKIQYIRTLKWWQYIGLFLFSLLIGSLQESFMLGFSGAIFLYYLFNYKKITKPLASLSLGLFIGTAFLVFAPGNFVRVNQSGMGLFHIGALIRFIITPSIGLLCLLLVYVFFLNKNLFVSFIRDNAVLFLTMFVALSFAFIIAYSGRQQIMLQGIIAIILLVRIINRIPISSFISTTSCIITGIVMLILFPYILYARNVIFEAKENLSQQIIKYEGQQYINGQQYDSILFYYDSSFLSYYNFIYALNYVELDDLRRGLSSELSFGKSLHWADKLLPVPINKIIKTCGGTLNQVYYLNNNNYVFSIKDSIQYKDVSIKYEGKQNLRMIYAEKSNSFVQNGRRYCLFKLVNASHVIDPKLIKITIY